MAMLSATNQKLKNTIEAQELEKVGMQQKIEEALKERMNSNLKLSDQKGKLENLISENKTYRDRISEQDDQMKKLSKQLKTFQGQAESLEQARGRITSLQESHKLQITQIEGKESELSEVKMTVNNL